MVHLLLELFYDKLSVLLDTFYSCCYKSNKCSKKRIAFQINEPFALCLFQLVEVCFMYWCRSRRKCKHFNSKRFSSSAAMSSWVLDNELLACRRFDANALLSVLTVRSLLEKYLNNFQFATKTSSEFGTIDPQIEKQNGINEIETLERQNIWESFSTKNCSYRMRANTTSIVNSFTRKYPSYSSSSRLLLKTFYHASFRSI